MENLNYCYIKLNINFIVGINIDDIKHQDSGYTFLTGCNSKSSWIKTEDIHIHIEDAEKGSTARFL